MHIQQLDTQQQNQENEYEFPYHHLVNIFPFSQLKSLFWGYEYASYMLSVFDKLEQIQFESLVDVGCGDGKFVKEISNLFKDKKIYGFDTSIQAINLASCFVSNSILSTKSIKADVFTLIEVLEHIPPNEIHDFVKKLPADIGIITVPTTINPPISKHYQHFNEEILSKLFKPYFRIVSMERLNVSSVGSKIIQRILSNRFFELKFGVELVFRLYHKIYGKASIYNGKRLLLVVERI